MRPLLLRLPLLHLPPVVVVVALVKICKLD
jgi:hypothetical protein